MNFYIYNIKVNSIASIGSLNIGNVILTRNQSTNITQTGGQEGSGGAGAGEKAGSGEGAGAVEEAGNGVSAAAIKKAGSGDGAVIAGSAGAGVGEGAGGAEEGEGGSVYTQSYSSAPSAEPEDAGILAGEPPAWRRCT